MWTQLLTTDKSAGRKQVATTPPGAIASPNLVVLINYPQISPHKGLKQNPSGLANAPAKSRVCDLWAEPGSRARDLFPLSLISFRCGATWWGHSSDIADTHDIKIKLSTAVHELNSPLHPVSSLSAKTRPVLS